MMLVMPQSRMRALLQHTRITKIHEGSVNNGLGPLGLLAELSNMTASQSPTFYWQRLFFQLVYAEVSLLKQQYFCEV